MKKIKRFAALLLAGVLALAVFTGCRQTDLSGKLEEKITEVYAKALGVKAAEVHLSTEDAALNKSVLDMIGEDGVLTIGSDAGNFACSNFAASFFHKADRVERGLYRMVSSVVFANGEPTKEAGRTLVPVATLKPEQVQAILAGNTSELKIDKLNFSYTEKINGIGVSAKQLKDGTYCYVVTIDMVS